MTVLVEAPTDPQLAFIRDLCVKLDVPEPSVIWLREDASRIIDALKSGRYRWQDYNYPEAQ